MGINLKKKGKKSRLLRNTTKTIATNWNPIEWVIDTALEYTIDWLFDTAEKTAEATDPELSIENQATLNQNTYVNNFIATTNDATIIQNITKGTTNYRNPIYRGSAQRGINYPPSTLPTEIDTQTETQTVGTSINVAEEIKNNKYLYGRLLYNPLFEKKKGVKRTIPKNHLIREFKEAQKKAIKSTEKQDEEKKPIEHNGYLYASKQLAGLQGEGHIIFGINSISALAQTYRQLSSMAYIEPTNSIPIEFEEVEVNDEYNELKFKGSANPSTTSLSQKLGFDLEGKTIEEIIKHFGEQQYKITANQERKNRKAKNVKEFKDSNVIEDLENTEQLIAHLVASIFYRNGFHRLPAIVPESILFDSQKYKKAKEQPNIFIEDSLEYQEYQLKSIDALIGQFPNGFTYKYEENGKKKEKFIKIPNLGEGLLEVIGSLRNVNADVDAIYALVTRILSETTKGANTAIVTNDIVRANADFLGYRQKEIEKEIDVSYNPSGQNLQEFITPSKQKLASIANDEKTDLWAETKLISLAVQICKSALEHSSANLTGEFIKEQREKDLSQYQELWNELLAKYNNNTDPSRNSFPEARLRDR